ncbi:MAG: acyl-CoA dehydrogenase family protein [Gammaproteobacteria bacterium]|nr:acyl-CoA dehydrogenase family protein [Gammaproteobacteria bacterium]MBU2071600.1 acyl-CoA dehydrogenase family protein [Gammaproteobacteria bacterium]MBU2184359.1 acyl-CoA dehydrogenase family protein [Gammaproteobacteria bacterium]MBU2203506.1 acyl-CoA dehydrogenase family protein [Gammaproteobacteria bacterium]
MSQYHAPLNDIYFNLFNVWQLDRYWQQQPQLAELLEIDTARAILEEAAKICEQQIAPYAADADKRGAQLQDGNVTLPEHYYTAYQSLAEGGWTGLSGDAEYGGMGMPKALSMMVDEMLCSADIAFSLYPGLTAGACVALLQHADDATKARYLPKMYSGEWSGTMCLTEAHAGSDLGIMRTTAKPNTDGSYAISGSKIFITAGEHDLTANIIHLVLAKLPDAPAGSRGISLFLVPKYLPDASGKPAERNGVTVGSIEHKMGINGSATCVLNFDDATGYLIGEPNRGLACMFTMMNYERLSMGSQGLGAAERAYQNAVSYAKERLQGRISEKDANKAEPIVGHADVRRMLLNIKAINEAGRTFATWVASLLDKAKYDNCPVSAQRANLLTPIAKAFMTDQGFDACVTAQQVFGGHGYIKEWGMEQLVRDVRIAQIYEGTNGIQAADFMLRKVAADKGDVLISLLNEISAEIAKVPQAGSVLLAEYINELQQLTGELLAQDFRAQSANACDYLAAVSYVLYGYMWYKNLCALDSAEASDSFKQAKHTAAAYYFARVLPKAKGLFAVLSEDTAGIDSLNPDHF